MKVIIEREIGEIFEYQNDVYKVEEANTCWKCDLYGVKRCQSIGGICEKYKRMDKKSVIYTKQE